jgi:hypothetical protein
MLGKLFIIMRTCGRVLQRWKMKVRKTQEGGVELCFEKFFVSPKN